MEKLRHELANYQKDKMSLQNAKSRLHVLETQLRDLTWEHEVTSYDLQLTTYNLRLATYDLTWEHEVLEQRFTLTPTLTLTGARAALPSHILHPASCILHPTGERIGREPSFVPPPTSYAAGLVCCAVLACMQPPPPPPWRLFGYCVWYCLRKGELGGYPTVGRISW